MLLKCPHCGYIWDYKGKSELYTSCPRCLYRVNIKKSRLRKEGEKDGH